MKQAQTNAEMTRDPQKLGNTPRKPLRFVVRQLCLLNDYLERHSTFLERKSLRYSLRMFCVREQVSRLGSIHEAAALLGHKDIEQGAKACLVRREAFDHKPAAGFHVIEPQDLKDQEPIFAQMSFAIYRGQKVLLDWFDLADRFRAPGLEVERKSYALAAILNQDLSALDISIPRCVGSVKRNKSHADMSGYAFSVPDNAFTSTRELRDLMSPKSTFDQPDLESRFELANALARTIFGMHLMDWFHGNLSTGNVVFCLHNEERELDLCHPYLLGFGLQENYESNQYKMFETYDNRQDLWYYRHPEFRDGWGNFKPSYDIYSLGVVLWEIGIWKTLQERLQGLTYTYNEVTDIRQMLTEEAINNLRGHMGDRYTDAVVACLDGSFDEIWEWISPDDSHQLQNHLRRFQEKIVDPLAACSV